MPGPQAAVVLRIRKEARCRERWLGSDTAQVKSPTFLFLSLITISRARHFPLSLADAVRSLTPLASPECEGREDVAPGDGDKRWTRGADCHTGAAAKLTRTMQRRAKSALDTDRSAASRCARGVRCGIRLKG